MTAKLVPDGLWEVIEPLIPYRSPSRKAVGRVYPIEFASGVFCLFFAAAFLGRCCPRNWVGSGMTCWRRLRDCRDVGIWGLIHFALLDWLSLFANRLVQNWSGQLFGTSSFWGPKTGPNPWGKTGNVC